MFRVRTNENSHRKMVYGGVSRLFVNFYRAFSRCWNILFNVRTDGNLFGKLHRAVPRILLNFHTGLRYYWNILFNVRTDEKSLRR